MIRDHRTPWNVIALGILMSLLSGCEHAGEEGKQTKPVVQPHSQLQGEPSTSAPDRANPADARSGWVQEVKKGAVHGFTKVFKDWSNPLGADRPSDPASAIAVNVRKVTLGKNAISKKIASEEHRLIKGVKLEVSRASTLGRGVSLPRAFETLFQGSMGGVVKAELGARISQMLGDEIRGATTTESLASIDGNVWERARIDWYAQIHSGAATLEVDGVTHELPFEYTIGFRPVVVGITERRPDDSQSVKSPVASSTNRVARVTTVSTYSPDLFEARFETAPAIVAGDKLPVFRGAANTRCMGYCEIVAVRGSRIVGRCDGFRPKVGDFVSQTGVAHGLNQTRR